MTASRIKSLILFGWLAVLAVPAFAQTPPTDSTLSSGRDASFLPLEPKPVDTTPAATKQPVPVAPETTSSNGLPAVSMPAAAENKKADILSQPVESEKLQSIDPDSIGLLSREDGGLGAGMWKGTSREFVTRVLPDVVLPTPSAALNGLAQRFLLTTANVPEGASDSTRTFTALRIDRLIALGDVGDAWKLAQMKPDRMDETTLRLTAEAALIGSDAKDVCVKIPDIIHTHTAPEWQKLLVTCQLQGGDTKGAQLALEVLHAQDVKDDAFFALAEHNIIGASKSLPRQLTPLKPLTLVLLGLTGEPLPPELFTHPDAALIPVLLQAKTHDDALRLGLAERAAARGLIGSAQLAAAYQATVFPPDQLQGTSGSSEAGPHLRALIYQEALAGDKTPQKQIDKVEKFLQSLEGPLNSVTAQLLTGLVGDIAAGSDYAAASPNMARLFIMANKPKEALAWIKIARQAPAATAQPQNFWPLVALAALESDGDYNTDLHAWFEAAIKDADHDRREQIGGLLLLLEADGYAVPEDIWAQIMDVAAAGRRTMLPPVLVLERLSEAGLANLRGETILLALAAANIGNATGGNNEPSLLSAIESVRALRLVGLTADAAMLARETAVVLLMPPRAGAKP